MKTAKYILELKGQRTPNGTVSVLALKSLLDTIIESSEKALRLSVEGTSTKKGQLPAWLKKSVDFTVTGIKKGSTQIILNAPKLSETAAEELKQPDLWNIMPGPEDTALSILTRAVKDAEAENQESNYYDNSLLKNLMNFDNILDTYADSIELFSDSNRKVSITFDKKKIEKISSISQKIPEAQKVLVSGYFNQIEHSEGRFSLKLQSGEVITGEIDKEFIDKEKMRSLWGNQATIRGTAEFRANKKIRYLKADYIKKFEENEKLLLGNIEASEPLLLFEKPEQYKKKSNPLADLKGQWPGDESIDELIKDLGDD